MDTTMLSLLDPSAAAAAPAAAAPAAACGGAPCPCAAQGGASTESSTAP
jgi:hypothetical protein